jgi:hypothetical protein
MSLFAPIPQDENGGPLLKFVEAIFFVTGPKTSKDNKQFYSFDCQATPWIDPDNVPTDPDAMKVRNFKTNNHPANRLFPKFWESFCIKSHDATGATVWTVLPAFQHALKTPDDLFTQLGEQAKVFLISYRTPLLLVPAKPDDLEYAKNNNAFHKITQNEIGQWMKKEYPWQLEKIYTDRATWEADAKANASSNPAPVVAPANDPDYAAALKHLPVLVKASGLNVATLETILSSNPHVAKFFNINSTEVKHAVATQVILQTGPTDENAIKGVLIGLNGGAYLDIESPEIVSQRESVAF